MRARALATIVLAGLAACSRPAPPPDPAGAPKAPQPAPAAAAEAPPALPYEIRLGKTIYERYCLTCHGETGAGDGFNAYNLDPHPRDLSEPAFQAKRKDADLQDAIRRGGSGVGLSALMPPWGHTLSDRQIADVIRYLRTFKRAPSS
jgi:mono/diheme cytochrome c family protein